MSSQHLLIVEDEAAIRDMLQFSLGKENYSVSEAESAAKARVMIADNRPDLILLDWMLPGESGMELLRQIKSTETTQDIPVIMLTARVEEEDKIRGLDIGADDYVIKPFSPKELLARIKAVLRRAHGYNDDKVLEIKGLRLEQDTHRVLIDEQELEIGPTEFRLLEFFLTHQERVYSRAQLLDFVWGNNVYIEERTIDVHIRRLRKVLAINGYDQYIQTVRGAGYRFSTRV